MTGNYSKVTSFFANYLWCGSVVLHTIWTSEYANATVNSRRKLKKFRVVVLIFSVDSESVLESFFNRLRGKVKISNFFPQPINKNSNT